MARFSPIERAASATSPGWSYTDAGWSIAFKSKTLSRWSITDFVLLLLSAMATRLAGAWAQHSPARRAGRGRDRTNAALRRSSFGLLLRMIGQGAIDGGGAAAASGISRISSIPSRPFALFTCMIGKTELALERTRGNTPMGILALHLVGLAALDGNHVLFGRDRDFIGAKPAGKRNLIAVLGETFDVVGGWTILASALTRFP